MSAMRPGIHGVVPPSELGEFADELKRVFVELGRTFGRDSLASECSPAVDVYETDQACEIRMDLPGIDASAIRIVIKGMNVLLAGEKPSRRGRGDSSFHLVERGFGRFARTVRLPAPCDGGHARATLFDGELRLSLPKIAERRGRSIRVAVEAAGA